MSIQTAIQRRGGVARTRDLLNQGVTAKTISDAVANGSIIRVRRGVFALEPANPVAIAAAHGGSLACVSALAAYDLWLLDPPEHVHVQVGAGGRVHQHSCCFCIDHHDPWRRTLGIMPLREALVQSRKCQSEEAFFAAFESAWNKGLLSAADRAWIRAHLPRAWRRVIAFARGDAQSGLESLLRYRLSLIGLDLRSQVVIPGVGRVDFVIGSLIIEVDGRLGHADPLSQGRDYDRDMFATAAGYRVLRFNYRQIISNWPAVQSAILTALGEM